MTTGPKPTSALAGMAAYRPQRHEAPMDLRLDGNEGAVPDTRLFAALESAGPEVMRRYPDAGDVTRLLAARLGVIGERLIVTAGADDALDRICRAYLGPGREILVSNPTFEMIPRYARIMGGTLVEVPWPDGAFPLQGFLDAITPQTAVIVVVTPNNPTGTVARAEDLARLSAAAPHALLVVDLAYTEFAEEDLTHAALALPNGVAVRTLSKAWGLAGLRVGYAAGPEDVIECLRAAGGPYSIARPSLALAAAALAEGSARVTDFVACVQTEARDLAAMLTELGERPVPSQANFAFARFRDAAWVCDALAGLGIAVRGFPARAGLEDSVRITCPGSPKHFARLTHALRSALAPEALLFDLDGVLANVSQSYRKALIMTAESFGATISRAEVSEAKSLGNANNDWVLTHRMLEARGISVSLEEVTTRFEELYQGSGGRPGLRATETMICAPELLERLAKRLPLAMVTGRPRADALIFCDEMKITRHFKTLVCMEDADALKPHPAPVFEALRRLGVQRAWMIGDTVDDARAARGASVIPLGVVAPGEESDAVIPVLRRAGAARVLSRVEDLELMLDVLGR